MGNARSKRNVGVTHANGAAVQLSEVYTRTGGPSNGGAPEEAFGRDRPVPGDPPLTAYRRPGDGRGWIDELALPRRRRGGPVSWGPASGRSSAIARESRIPESRSCVEADHIVAMIAVSTKGTGRRSVASGYRADGPISCMGTLRRPTSQAAATQIGGAVHAAFVDAISTR